jgi:O-antigen/teichoic acid export membrane protein
MPNNTSSLKSRIISSLSWNTLSFGSSQALRFLSNIVLTKLLYPEAFGLITLTQTIIFGATMLADLGVKTVIIQDPIGDNQEFLNTAWLMHLLQGLVVFLLTIPLSFWAASHYHQPDLKLLIIATGFTTIISCLESTKITSARRKMQLKEVTIIALASQIISIIVTLLFAWQLKNVWAIVIGNLIGVVLNTALSHTYIAGENNQFHFNKSHAKKIFNFSKWIFISSSLTFVAGEGNKLLIGTFMSLKDLALYGIAANLSSLSWLLTQVFSSSLYPAYTEVYRTAPEKFNHLLTKSRLLLINSSVIISFVLVIAGPKLTVLLYDSRYDGVGEYLRILALGAIIASINTSYMGVLFAINKAKLSTYLLIIQIIIQCICVYIGYQINGSMGIVIGISILNILMYIFYSLFYYPLKIWQPKIDFPYILLAFVLSFILYK